MKELICDYEKAMTFFNRRRALSRTATSVHQIIELEEHLHKEGLPSFYSILKDSYNQLRLDKHIQNMIISLNVCYGVKPEYRNELEQLYKKSIKKYILNKLLKEGNRK